MYNIGQLILLVNGTRLDESAGLVPCDGRGRRAQDYPGLFNLIGYLFGNDGNGIFLAPSVPLPSGLASPAAYFLCTLGNAPNVATSNTYTGSVERFVRDWTNIPPNFIFLPCNGNAVPVDTVFQALYSLLLNSYGGYGPNDFNLPLVPTDVNFYPSMPNGGYYICTSGIYPPTPPVPLENFYVGQLVLLPRQGSQYQDALQNEPQGLLPCSGALVKLQDWPLLYSLIGNQYGGSIQQGTFGLPNVPPPTGLESHGYYIAANGIWPASE